MILDEVREHMKSVYEKGNDMRTKQEYQDELDIIKYVIKLEKVSVNLEYEISIIQELIDNLKENE